MDQTIKHSSSRAGSELGFREEMFRARLEPPWPKFGSDWIRLEPN